VSTIPATIAPLEQYADYKSVSVKGKLNCSTLGAEKKFSVTLLNFAATAMLTVFSGE
jgi:hypothetical protein